MSAAFQEKIKKKKEVIKRTWGFLSRAAFPQGQPGGREGQPRLSQRKGSLPLGLGVSADVATSFLDLNLKARAVKTAWQTLCPLWGSASPVSEDRCQWCRRGWAGTEWDQASVEQM